MTQTPRFLALEGLISAAYITKSTERYIKADSVRCFIVTWIARLGINHRIGEALIVIGKPG